MDKKYRETQDAKREFEEAEKRLEEIRRKHRLIAKEELNGFFVYSEEALQEIEEAEAEYKEKKKRYFTLIGMDGLVD